MLCNSGELYVVMELSLDGSLDTYLRKSKPPDDLTAISNKKKYRTMSRTLNTQTLLKFCVQVATAMEYLGIKKVTFPSRNTTNLVALTTVL